ncbi:MAG: asparagine synthetase B family protein, partial [Planctomycetota bacterium]
DTILSCEDSMSGLCGWAGHPAAPGAARELLGAMAAPLSGFDGSRPCLLAGATAAVAASSLGGAADLCRDHELLAAVAGHPRWTDPSIEEAARKQGNAKALLDGYRARGPRILESLAGPFAVAVLRDRNGEALLAVDRAAVGSLTYAAEGGCLVFSTHGDSLAAHPSGRAELDRQSLYDYLYFHVVPGPATIRRGHRRVLPGEWVRWKDGRVATGAYWRMEYREDDATPLPRLEREFREVVRESVRRAAEGGRPGCFLSGGTDSSTVSGMVREATGTPARTFSIGFQAEGYDEMEYAREAARRFRCEHHEHYVTPEDVAAAVPRIAAIYSDPFGNASAAPTYCCARAARELGVDLMLAGDGGDELFAGNERYATQWLFDLYGRVPRLLRRGLVEPLLSAVPAGDRLWPVRKARSYVRQANVPMPDRLMTYNVLDRLGAGRVLDADFLQGVDTSRPGAWQREIYDGARATTLVNRMMALDLRITLADCDLPKVGRMCELAGVRVAYPFLSDEVIAFSARVPSRWKIKRTRLRWFFKHALRDFLPRKILTKRKHGFGLPFGVWLRDRRPLQELAYDSLADLKKRRVVRAAFVDELVHAHRTGHAAYHGTFIWVLMMLEQWYKAHVDRPAPAPP